MLSSSVGLSLGISMVAIAGANVWLALRTTGNRARQTRAHRLGGYLFLTLFFVPLLYMNQRVPGVTPGPPITVVPYTTLCFLRLALLWFENLFLPRSKYHCGTLRA